MAAIRARARRFASLEQLQGDADERSDIYSLGGTAFFLLTGEDPFDPELPIPELLRVKGRRPPKVRKLNPGMNKKLTALVEKMMAPDPHKRPPTCEAVIAALDQIEPERRRD